jgi:hypothetical protein
MLGWKADTGGASCSGLLLSRIVISIDVGPSYSGSALGPT